MSEETTTEEAPERFRVLTIKVPLDPDQRRGVEREGLGRAAAEAKCLRHLESLLQVWKQEGQRAVDAERQRLIDFHLEKLEKLGWQPGGNLPMGQPK